MINPEIEKIIEYATITAKQKNHEYVLAEHLLFSLIIYSPFQECLRSYGVQVDHMVSDIENYLDSEIDKTLPEDGHPRRTAMLERILNRAVTQAMFYGKQFISTLDLFFAISSETSTHASFYIVKYGIVDYDAFSNFWRENYDSDNQKISESQASEILNEHCVNVSNLSKQGKLEPLIGRSKELKDAIEILAKKFKSNILMVGAPGVGKTSLVEGLAQKITAGEVPKFLEDHTVWSLNISHMLAGSKYRGDFEDKFKKVSSALEASDKNILFIDEAHTMRGAGAGQGNTLDFANMLKPLIERGTIKVIANTTWDEYYESFSKDKALLRRFYLLRIDEPDHNTTVKILSGVASRLSEFHNVEISPDAIALSVELSSRYIHDRKNPDKSIDILDAACASERAKDLKGILINEKKIIRQVSKITGIPKEKLENEKSEDLVMLRKKIDGKLFGQDEPVDKVLKKLYVNFSGLGDENKPMASFLFLGGTGVGKTELAKLIGEHLNMKLIRFDMSEFYDKHTMSRLIGSPPGYVGFGESSGNGELITAIDKNPYSILLLDEIEKAHPDIFNVLLQVLDEGVLKSSSGKEVSMKNCIVILTSNLGAEASEQRSIGFTTEERTGYEEQAAKEFFRPEFRNRLDGTVKFNRLSDIDIQKIVVKFINELKVKLKPKKIDLVVSDNIIDHIAKVGYDPTMGARPINRTIDDLIKVPLSECILFNGLKNCVVEATIENEKVVFIDSKTKKVLELGHVDIPEPSVSGYTDQDGYIVVNNETPKE